MSRKQSWVDRWWPERPTTAKEIVEYAVPGLTLAVRLTTAAVLAFLLTRWYTGGSNDLTGALSALLVTQASGASSIKYGLIRVSAVLLGVSIAILIASQMGLNPWSLALAVFSGVVVAKLFRIKQAVLEVPISAMLILQASSILMVGQEIMPAAQRLTLTGIGSAVGIVLMLLFPPRIPEKSAAAMVRGVALALQRPLQQAAAVIAEKPITSESAKWSESTLAVNTIISDASKEITEVEELRKWNSRAIGAANIVPILRSGLDTLQRCHLAVRAMFIVLESNTAEAEQSGQSSKELRAELSKAFILMGSAISSFGDLVQAEAKGSLGSVEDNFRDRLDELRAQRDLLVDTMVVDPADVQPWLMRGSILSAIDQVLETLDIQARIRIREQWELTQAGLWLPEGQVGEDVDISPSSRRWLARERSEAALAEGTAQADFLSDSERTQVLPIAELQASMGRAESSALGALRAADRTGNFDVVERKEDDPTG